MTQVVLERQRLLVCGSGAWADEHAFDGCWSRDLTAEDFKVAARA